VRDLPATREWADALDLADTQEAFSAAVRRRIETGVPAGQRAARARLAGESWAVKARALEHWIDGPRPAAVACPYSHQRSARRGGASPGRPGRSYSKHASSAARAAARTRPS